MKVGASIWFQNMPDMQQRAMRGDYDRPMPKSDFSCIQDDLSLCDMLEPLGFDRFWTIEHHCSPYGMTVSPLQLFSYVAGRTTKLGFGSMVLVLPWNDPIRLAGEIAMLDIMMQGRDLRIGVGRGAAPQEFEAFRTDYAESRERLAEILEIVRLGLTREWFSFDGKHYKIPHTSIRPQPLSQDLTEKMLMAWSSADTREMAAESGLGPIFNNFHNWGDVVTQMDEFNGIRRKHGWHDVIPTVAGPMFCSRDKEKVRQAREWVKMTYDTSMWHYGIMTQPSMKKFLAGKEGKELEEAIEEIRNRALVVGAFGSPEECLDTLLRTQELTGYGELICQVHYGMMPYDWAKESMELFAAEVLPELHKVQVKGSIPGTPFKEVEATRLREAAALERA